MDYGMTEKSTSFEASGGEERRGIRHQLDQLTKEMEALGAEVGALEDRLTPLLRPNSPGIKLVASAITADEIGENPNISPLVTEVQNLGYRLRNIRGRVQDLFTRADF